MHWLFSDQQNLLEGTASYYQKKNPKAEDPGLRRRFPPSSNEFLGKLLSATQAWFSMSNKVVGAILFQHFLGNITFISSIDITQASVYP